jgi:hypothetical protein
MSRDNFPPRSGGADTFWHPAPLRGRAVMLIVVGAFNSSKTSDSNPPCGFMLVVLVLTPSVSQD